MNKARWFEYFKTAMTLLVIPLAVWVVGLERERAVTQVTLTSLRAEVSDAATDLKEVRMTNEIQIEARKLADQGTREEVIRLGSQLAALKDNILKIESLLNEILRR